MTAGPQPRFGIRRAYDAPSRSRSYQVLVDRLWPRGVRKDEAALDEWAKDVAPSDALRRWYGHEPEKFPEFALRYRTELEQSPGREVVTRLRAEAKSRPVTLVTATRDVEHSGAAVLRDVLAGRATRPASKLD
jgi:uncharacterized protein YeaO (DUF488 family)